MADPQGAAGAPQQELKPCPFCGGPAKRGRGDGDTWDHFVHCVECGAGVGSDDKERATLKWDTRT